MTPCLLYQLCMVLDCGFDLLRFNTDVPLCSGCAAVLQQSLNQRNVKSVCVVNLRRVPLAEAVSADPIEVQIIAYDF